MGSVENNHKEQKTRIVLSWEQYQHMIGGEYEGYGPTLHDVTGACVLANGEAEPGYEQFWKIFHATLGAVKVGRRRADGTVNAAHVWTGPEGIISTVENHTDGTVTMMAADRDSRFTLLIDSMVLGRRNFRRHYEPGHGVIKKKDFLTVLIPDDLPAPELADSVKALADSVSHIQPEIAQDLVDGQYEMIVVEGTYQAGDRDEAGVVIYLDTPHGYLLYDTERRMLRKEYQLHPAPGWYILQRAVSLLPPQWLIEAWQDETEPAAS